MSETALADGRKQARWGGWRALIAGLAVVLGVDLAHTVVVNGLQAAYGATAPAFALSLGPDAPDVLSAAAARRLKLKDLLGADALSRAALDRSPLNVPAIRTRAMVLDAEERTGPAAALYRFAGGRSWRDNAVQAWLLKDALVRGSFADAAPHADALLRRRDEFQPSIFLLFEAAAADSHAAEVLAARLAVRPPWRGAFLDALARSPQTDAATARLFADVDRSAAPLAGEELGDYPQRLIREGRYHDAFRALAAYRGGPTVLQPSFAGMTSDRRLAPFTWLRLEAPGAALDLAAAPGRPGASALRVQYEDPAPADLIRRALAPAPGRYRLSGDAFAEAGDPRRLGWQVRCIADGRAVADVSPEGGAPSLWRPFHADFVVPQSGCDGVRLVLQGRSAERRASTVVWFDAVAITPLDGPN